MLYNLAPLPCVMTYVSYGVLPGAIRFAAMKYRERYIGCRLIRYSICGAVIFLDIESWRHKRYLPRRPTP
jgi:hypothetical protein